MDDLNSIEQFLSFWGSVASIIALLVSVAGALIVYIKNAKKRYNSELEVLNNIQESFNQRASTATTQGKRLDLFIYYESRLSMMRFNELVEEIQLGVIHLISFLGWLFLASLDANSDYYLDRAFGSTGYFYDYFGLVFSLLTFLFVYINFSARKSIYKNR